MANNPNAANNLTPTVKGQVLNPHGRPKGSKNLSTWIQDLLNDETFETQFLDSRTGIREYKGAPIKAIIQVAIHRALHDEKNGIKWAEWLGKYGYGIALKIEDEHTLEVVHIYKPEKLVIESVDQEAEHLRLRAEKAVEAELDDLESTTRPADIRPTAS